MERTIDGIDYIAKSELLRLINEDMRQAQELASQYPDNERHTHGWVCRYHALKDLREALSSTDEI